MKNICLKQDQGRRARWQTSTTTSLEYPPLELRKFNCDLNTSLSPGDFYMVLPAIEMFADWC